MQYLKSEAAAHASRDLPVGQYLDALYRRHAPNTSGALANYIPELAKVSPDQFAIAFATTDGFVYEVGDHDSLFTIQSISKAVIYGLALEDHGRDAVLRKIGVEPSGEAFNSIIFDERNNRPFNPMVNAGAIAATALIRGADHAERLQRIMDIFRRFTGRVLDIDEDVYRSESRTGHRNRAIAYLELNSGMIEGNLDEHLDLYFRQCSLLVKTRDLALIAATLANDGINPVTRERALAPANVRSVLSVMNTCGMYDYAGSWQLDVGLPAKSGVGGGIVAVLPSQLGIGVFSPRLDAVGNSLRGVKVCEDISSSFRLHLFEGRAGRLLPFRRLYRGDEIHSKRLRRSEQAKQLDRFGHLISVYELQAEIGFIEAEQVTRRVIEDLSTGYFFILDLSRVLALDAVALDLLNAARLTLLAADKSFAVVTTNDKLHEALQSDGQFANIDAALEYFEDRLLERAESVEVDQRIPLEQFDLLANMDAAAIAAFAALLEPKQMLPGETIISQNAPAHELYFLIEGRVDVSVRIGNGPGRRVATIDAGTMFGELALFGNSPRTADVIAVTAGELLVLKRAAFDTLREKHHNAYTALLLAVGTSLSERLRRANAEIRALSK